MSSYIKLAETPSTNTALRTLLDEDPSLPAGTVVYTHRQTSGRGQRGNSWEAEPGMNLTMSLLLRPETISAREQFVISECVALSVALTLDRYLPKGMEAEVKWPNDVYVGDKKICGILIENSLIGTRIDHTIAGIGININQQEFRSSAPNPISLARLTGATHDVEAVMRDLVAEIERLADISQAELHSLYRSKLWRRNGQHPYSTPDGKQFNATIIDIATDGYLTLQPTDGPPRRFAFKEVAAIL